MPEKLNFAGIAGAFGRKLGPLPIWGWGVGASAVIIGGRAIISRRAAAAAAGPSSIAVERAELSAGGTEGSSFEGDSVPTPIINIIMPAPVKKRKRPKVKKPLPGTARKRPPRQLFRPGRYRPLRAPRPERKVPGRARAVAGIRKPRPTPLRQPRPPITRTRIMRYGKKRAPVRRRVRRRPNSAISRI